MKLHCQRKDGSSDWIDLKHLEDSNPIELTEYAVANHIQEEPAFKWWVTETLQAQNRLIWKVKRQSWKTSHIFGVRLPIPYKKPCSLIENWGPISGGRPFKRKLLRLKLPSNTTRSLYRCIHHTEYCEMGVLMYGRPGYCLPLLHLRHQHISICPDVDVRTLMLHNRDSKLNANLCVTLSKSDDAPMYGRTQHLSGILRAGRAYRNSKI
jgi:hypothetical protein